MLSVDAVRNHVTGIRLSTVPMCSESGNLPVTELVYTIKWFTSLGADWDAARVYTGCCTAWQISDRELPPRSIYDILTQIWFSMVIYHIQCRQTFVVASQRVRCRHGVTHLSRRTKATSASDRRPSAPWVLSSAGKLIRYLHESYFLTYHSADIFHVSVCDTNCKII